MLEERYLQALTPFARAAMPWIYALPGDRRLMAYGPGYDGWGVQTNQKAFAALAVLATHPGYDESLGGVSRDELTARALGLLRFSLASHVSGTACCTDGRSWGHTWISALGVERMMHAIEAIDDALEDDDRADLRRMLCSEADWLLDCYPVVAGPVENNKPESNIWNGALLWRTAMMYPDAPRAEAWRDKAVRFLVNGISVPDDATSEDLLEGRPVREWYEGHNFFASMALNHHRYLNVGYMVICLSNLAMLHFACRTRQIAAPDALYRHVEELYDLVRACTFPDGRLMRIGGDTRARYCYCQDYAIPMWMMMADRYGDAHAPGLEAGWIEQVLREVEHNGDGAYLSDRCGQMRQASPLYYTRLESDRAAAISMGAWWRQRVARLEHFDEPARETRPATYDWHDPYHGACLTRGARRAASFVWDAAENPTGLCVPLASSDMAEWRENLAGKLRGEGIVHPREILNHEERPFEGGFLTWGATRVVSKGMIAEGHEEDELGVVHTVYAALPDDATCLVIQRAGTPRCRHYFTEIKGLHLLVPNDLFNGAIRTYRTADGEIQLRGIEGDEEIVDTRSRRLTVDGHLSVALAWGADSLKICRPGRRQIGLKPWLGEGKERAGGMLWCDEIVVDPVVGMQAVDADRTVFDLGVALRVGSDEAPSCQALEGAVAALRGMTATGADGREYLLVWNWGERESGMLVDREAEDLATGERIAGGDKEAEVFLGPGEARLLRLA